MKYRFLFESNPKSLGYVGVMADSPVYSGSVASQNAGSSDIGLYYRVDGGGLNQQFAKALGPTLTASVNQALQAAYDERYGAGAWQADAVTGRADRLTSFYIPMPAALPADSHVGHQAVAMVYSVGPHLPQHIVDRPAFLQVYVDALQCVAAAQQAAGAGAARIALRLTLLSTGIYGGIDASTPHTVADALYQDVAALVLQACTQAAKAPNAADLPTTLLINADQHAGVGTGKEWQAFTRAAAHIGITVGPQGFDLDV